MVKLVFCCRRKPEASVEDFQRYWLERHGPLVKSLRDAFPGMRRYVQSHTMATPVNDALRTSRGADEPFDGITEVWFDDVESLGTTVGAIEAGRRLLEDERTFLDLGRSSLFLTTEHEIF
jgi:uncharacterized protein (TIGR02118 family)